MRPSRKEESIVLFDGYCNFCSAAVGFILHRDPRGNFLFAASQSPSGKELVRDHGIGELARHSIVLISRERIYKKSGAALRIAAGLKGFWPLLYAGIILPRPFRDAVYDLFARNRYRIFGMRDRCFMPDPGMEDRFLKPF